ncbi:MAG: tetratricopeptide repeat protein [Pseudomonadota bacterium]
MQGYRFWLRGFAIAALMVLSACESIEQRAEGHYESALALLEEGDLDRATVEFRNVFELVENHRGARTAFAQALFENGRTGQAYGQYLFIAEQFPDDLEARVRLSRISFLRRNWEEFDRHAAAARELAPEDPQVVPLAVMADYRTAAVADDAGARNAAVIRAEALQEQRPRDQHLRRVRIDGYALQGRYDDALEQIDILLEAAPRDRTMYNQKLSILARIGATSAIEDTLRQMVDTFRNDDTVKAQLIRFYVTRGDLDAAETFLREIADPASEDPARWIDLVRFLSEVRGPEAAREAIATGIAQSPRPEVFLALRAGLDFEAGEMGKAIRDLEGVIAGQTETNDETSALKVMLSRMYIRQGNQVGARRLVEEVLAEDVTNVDALKIQASWAIEDDDTDTAITRLREALDAAPEDAQAMTLMAQAYTRAGQPALARDFLALAVDASGNAPEETVRYALYLMEEERYLAAEDILLASLRLAPENLPVLQTLGDLYLRMDDTGRARQVIDVLRRTGAATALNNANALEARLRAAQGTTEEVLSFLQELTTEEDAGPAAQLTFLQAQLRAGNFEAALALAETLVAENPAAPVFAFALAATQVATGDLASGAAGYRALLDADPARPRVWLELTRVLDAQGDRENAEAAIAEGLAANPDHPDLLWAQASFLEQNGDIDGAIAIYEAIYERNSSSIVVANNLASLLATHRADDPAALERAWVVGRRLNGTELPPAQDTYGWILHLRGDSAAAVGYLEPAAAGLPNDPVVQYHLAEVYAALGRTEEARAQYLQAVDVAGPLDTRPQIEAARAALATGVAEEASGGSLGNSTGDTTGEPASE